MPYTATMEYAIFVTLSRSSDAPVVILCTKSSSAARPPKATAILSRIASLENKLISAGRYCAKPKAPLDRGTMDTFSKGSACSRNHPATACPDSWRATAFFSAGLMRLFDFGKPPSTRSVARSKSCISTCSAERRAAKIAASLQTFAMSAPTMPGVRDAILLATSSGFRPSCRAKGFKWTRKICSLSARSGLSTAIWRSKRPGLVRAGSKMSARFVPASTTTPVPELNPSISTSIWLRVFSRSSLPPANPPFPRRRPTASISSMNTMDGELARAC
mmetsp:Transcript_59534/g.141991  ORF Transcript_59534/g.141991 Transcript_59534/m.141991 type:complete len:275 (-) Transcript_59534:207-1031(-)